MHLAVHKDGLAARRLANMEGGTCIMTGLTKRGMLTAALDPTAEPAADEANAQRKRRIGCI